MIDISAAVFVKSPGYSPLKTRLATGIGQANAEEFHRRAIRCIREVLQCVSADFATRAISFQPVWAVAEPEAQGESCWSDFPVMGQGVGELGNRLDFVYSRLIERSRIVLLLGADSPQLAPQTVVELVRRLFESLPDGKESVESEQPRFAIVPANDGGFSLFGGSRPVPESVWTSVPYSSDRTTACLVDRLVEFAPVELAPVDRLDELIDVDNIDDLKLIVNDLNSERSLPSQRNLGQWIEELVG